MEDTRAVLRHLTGTIALRAHQVLADAPDSFWSYEPGDGARTPLEILRHLSGLSLYAQSLLYAEERAAPLEPAPTSFELHRFWRGLLQLDDALAQHEVPETWPTALQGPLTDMVAHIGQLAFLRRLSGSPVARVVFPSVSLENWQRDFAQPS